MNFQTSFTRDFTKYNIQFVNKRRYSYIFSIIITKWENGFISQNKIKTLQKQKSLRAALRGITKTNFQIFKMDSIQIILALSQQNTKLMEENASLKAELAKYQIAQVVQEFISPISKRQKKVENQKPKHSSHIETGRKLVLLNAIRKEFLKAAQFEGEW